MIRLYLGFGALSQHRKEDLVMTSLSKGMKVEDEVNALRKFEATFDQKSSRVFHACHTIIGNRNAIVKENNEYLSVCNVTTKQDKGDGKKPEDDLVLIHYFDQAEIKMKETAQKGSSMLPDEKFWLVKGWVFSNDTGKLIARAFPYTPKLCIDISEFSRKLNILSNEGKNVHIREYVEGVVGKIFTYKGKVYFSGTRRIEALPSKKDACPSNKDQLADCGVDIEKLYSDKGIVYVVVLVHPRNQIQNPNPVKPVVYHLDTWMPTKDNTDLVRCDRDLSSFGIKRLPKLSNEDALKAFSENRYIYIQESEEVGCVYFSDVINTRLKIRGEKEHLFHQYVSLSDEDKPKLEQCVGYDFKKEVALFPNRFEEETLKLKNYIMGLLTTLMPVLPPIDTSVYALYLSAKHLPQDDKLEERVLQLLGSVKGSLLYNLLSVHRTKIEKRRIVSGKSTSPGPSPSPSSEDLH